MPKNNSEIGYGRLRSNAEKGFMILRSGTSVNQ